jgi:hypothetical protein
MKKIYKKNQIVNHNNLQKENFKHIIHHLDLIVNNHQVKNIVKIKVNIKVKKMLIKQKVLKVKKVI